MVIVAFVFALLGIILAIVAMTMVVAAVWKKREPPETLPDGAYLIHLVGYDKLTNEPKYNMEKVDAKSRSVEEEA